MTESQPQAAAPSLPTVIAQSTLTGESWSWQVTWPTDVTGESASFDTLRGVWDRWAEIAPRDVWFDFDVRGAGVVQRREATALRDHVDGHGGVRVGGALGRSGFSAMITVPVEIDSQSAH